MLKQIFAVGAARTESLRLSADSVQACRRICQAHAKSFYLASWALPKAKRQAAWVVYAFSRISDDLVDQSGFDACNRFEKWRLAIRQAFTSGRSDDEVLDAFVRVCRINGISFSLVRQLLDGLGQDLEKSEYRTFDQLEAYCFKVASIPGLMMLRVLGCTDKRAEKPAADLGIAMQLTNILRDLKDDAAHGKVYLPQRDLKKFSYSVGQLESGLHDLAFGELLAFEVARARRYYGSAEKGITYLPKDARLCVRLCAAFYGHILSELSKPGFSPLTRRASVPLWKKAILAAHLLVAHFSQSFAPADSRTVL
ncbi:phytoene/squalene synthase family protein [Candidatus Micrarchaeota archaeon]|nr:phytoene/squalene synthase family protein [Candidatus Micrarchaeota archaeon]